MVKNPKDKKPKYYLNEEGEFVIENYNSSKPFANFFPGIAGKYGIPMWVFYVNRGQAISSFGIKDKDHSILEFFPANKAWQMASSQGFRTFIKVSPRGKKTIFYEPFQNGSVNSGFNIANSMRVSSSGLTLEEDNISLGLKVKVEYFNIPNDSYAGLARIVTIKNSGRSAKKIQLLDGLPQIVPYGVNNFFLKKMSRTIEAWMNVENLDKGAPFYKLDVDPSDRPEVIHIKEGNFYLGFLPGPEKPKIIKPIVDPQCIFGPPADFSLPHEFLAANNFRYPKEQITKSKTPCAFLLFNFELSDCEEKVFCSVAGSMSSVEMLNTSLNKITAAGYLARKKEENKNIISGIESDIATVSSSRHFDLYAKQTYLDNVMRGGYPLTLSDSVFYLYSRKHGDLERDYNKFQLQPAYFSQGNGNYRDMNQNRRSDAWFNPGIKDENLIYFFNLLQADGFNPLIIKGTSFKLKEGTDLRILLKGLAGEEDILKIASFLDKLDAPPDKSAPQDKRYLTGFTPGELIFFIEENKIKLNAAYDEFIGLLISNSLKLQEAEHGEGFWTDHWAYNLDLLDSFLSLYPEKYREIFFDKRVFTFYDNIETVKPRQEKYLLRYGKVRQLHSLVSDNAKKEMIRKRTTQAHVVRTQYGLGEIYQTTLINKLLCLLATKLASLDPFGCGIEMEADKPNWFDALNGLPSLFGSSLCETFELKRLILLITRALGRADSGKVRVTEEIHNFLIGLNSLTKEYFNASQAADADYQYWDKSHSLKEGYNHKTRLGFSGKEIEMETNQLKDILNAALEKVNTGIDRSLDKKRNTYYAYFINEVVEYEPLKEPFVKPTKFIQKRLPFFLEGQMHALRLCKDINTARSLYRAIRLGELYDKKLKMYKVTAPLISQPEEIGRCRVFTPGWLENESIWLHMEYKYLLEILKQGLYKEFYEDFKNVLIPFQDPVQYGRSTLENSSFLVSSAFPDKHLHGNGFVARLSGSTAEFLEIWLTMNIGSCPFFLNEQGELNLKIEPLLAGWLFRKKEKTYTFNFLGKIQVTYYNSLRKDTFGKDKVTCKKILFNDAGGNPVEIPSNIIPAPYAQQIRSGQVNFIDIYLGK
ncbi:MAG: cellobiose phosphorylase [Candidatus Omnitrophota bacterium]